MLFAYYFMKFSHIQYCDPANPLRSDRIATKHICLDMQLCQKYKSVFVVDILRYESMEFIFPILPHLMPLFARLSTLQICSPAALVLRVPRTLSSISTRFLCSELLHISIAAQGGSDFIFHYVSYLLFIDLNQRKIEFAWYVIIVIYISIISAIFTIKN